MYNKTINLDREIRRGNIWFIFFNRVQFTEIVTLLKNWREERNIKWDIQRTVFLGNSLEEITEFERAENDFEKVDAICDLIVFHINSMYNNSHNYERYLENVADAFMNCKSGYNTNNLMENLLKYSRGEIGDDKYLFTLFYGLFSLGYDPYKSMIETIKEISSRKQDPKQAAEWESGKKEGKWMKDKNQDPSTLYKADYNSCKIDNLNYIREFYSK